MGRGGAQITGAWYLGSAPATDIYVFLSGLLLVQNIVPLGYVPLRFGRGQQHTHGRTALPRSSSTTGAMWVGARGAVQLGCLCNWKWRACCKVC